MKTDRVRPSALAEQDCAAGLRSLRAAMRALERERVWLMHSVLPLLRPFPQNFLPLLYKPPPDVLE